jgi:hypothetical protein
VDVAFHGGEQHLAVRLPARARFATDAASFSASM